MSHSDTLEAISQICREKKVNAIVLGVPYSASEEVQERYRAFGEELSKGTGKPVQEWDETFSTKQAQNMVAFTDPHPGKKEKKSHKDEVAAAVILQEFLDHENSH